MGTKHSADDFLAAALEVALADGLSALSYARVAARLGTNDRTVVYYFPSKEKLLSEVLLALGGRLQAALGGAAGLPAADHVGLLKACWPVLSDPAADRVFALFFESVGLAAVGREPYAQVVPALVEAWIAWAADNLAGTRSHRRAEAEAAVAVADGLLILRQTLGPTVAARAARQLGI